MTPKVYLRPAGMLVIGLLGLAASSSLAEVALADFSRVLRRWGVDDGLIGGRVEAVVQTPDRHLWIGTEDGLFRFNGASFERIDTAMVPELGHPWVTRLCADIDGSIWLGTADGRVAVLSGSKFVAVKQPWEGATSSQWIAHPDGGILASIDGGTQSFIVHYRRGETEILTKDVEGTVTALHMDRDHRLWVGLRGLPVAELRDGKLESGEGGGAPGTSVIVGRKDGTMLAIGRAGIYAYLDGGWREQLRFDAPLKDTPAFGMEDLDGRVWFGGRESDRMVWTKDGSLQRLRAGRDSLPGVILSSMADADGDLWFASFSGLFQAHYQPFLTWKAPVEVPTERTVGVRPRPDGSVWSYGFGGVCRLSPGASGPVLETTRPTAELTICDADEAGNLWLANRDAKFSRWSAGGELAVPVRGGRPLTAPTSLVVDYDGIAWFTTYSTLFRCDPSIEPLEYLPASGRDGLPEGSCHQIRLASSGDLLVAALGYGIFRRLPDANDWKLATPPGDPVAAEVETFDLDREGRVWGYVRRQDRIGCWTPDGSASATLAELGLGQIRISSVAVDDHGELWLATRNHGVVMLRCDDLLATARDPEYRPSLVWFDMVSGLGSKGGSYASQSIAKSSDGRIWVATDGGLSVIDPRQWLAERARASIHSTSIKVCAADGAAIDLSGPARIPAGTARVEIGFSALSFGFPGEVTYRYRLRGTDDRWIVGGDRGEARFQNLQPGHYVFEVAAANRFGSWDQEPTKLPFTVLPFWWQRMDVRLAGVMLVALTLAAIFRARTAARDAKDAMRAEFSRQLIVSQEEERRRISRELHDSLGQNLLVAKNQLYLAQELDGGPPLQEKLTRISESVSAALEEARSISHQLRPFQLERLGLAKALRAMIRETSDSTKIPIKSDIDEIGGLLSSTSEAMLYRIVQEALSNIVKHADASHVEVQVAKAGDKLRLVVQDDGRGFDAKALRPGEREGSGIGMASFRERADLLGGQFRCQTSPGNGTVLTIDIPIASSSEQ